jgi:tripartite-type tricarboxylate transporter receptor subunit TctC
MKVQRNSGDNKLDVAAQSNRGEDMRRCSLMLILLAWSLAAGAQPYPAKPIRLIVAFPAGGGSDVMARVLVQRLADRIGQQFIVDNRPGAGGSIGTEAAVKSAPDGYTLQLASTSEVSINRSLYTKLAYDPLKDLSPIGMVATTPMVLIVHPSMPVKDVKQLVALAKARPATINYGSAGAGSTTHLAAELFKASAGIDIVHVPYKGAPPALADLAGGHVQMMFSTLPATLPLVRANRLRSLAVTSKTRADALPAVPTMIEAGHSDYEVQYWYGLFAPRDTSAQTVSLINKHLVAALRSPELVADIRKQGAEPAILTLDEFSAFLIQDAQRWSKAVKVSGATAN